MKQGKGGFGSQTVNLVEGRTGINTNFYESNVYLGKGLKEPCNPFRSTYVFGAGLNIPSAKSWNCPPEIVEPTAEFDLKLIVPDREIVVGLINVYSILTSSQVTFKWWRKRDEKLLYEYKFNVPSPPAGQYWLWYYVYSYIGYIEKEIWENGQYQLDVYMINQFGNNKLIDSKPFTITGVAEYSDFFITNISLG